MAERSIPSLHRTETILLEGGERFTLVVNRQTGIPDAWICRYLAIAVRTKGGSTNSMKRSAAALAKLRDWEAARDIDMNARVLSGYYLSQDETASLSEFMRSRTKIRKKHKDKRIVAANTHHSRLRHIDHFIGWMADYALRRINVSPEDHKHASERYDRWTRGLATFSRAGSSGTRMGLNHAQDALFCSAIHPKSPINPFSEAQRDRNYALLLTYYKLGVRRGEPLLLKSKDLIFRGQLPSVNIVARPGDPEDPRIDQPLVKTSGRLLPLGLDLVDALETWIIKHRSDRKRYPNAKKHPYVFVSSNGKPMSLRTVYDLFVRLREAIPGLPEDFSPHTLRHTWNDRYTAHCEKNRKNQQSTDISATSSPLKEDEETATRNYLMGWKPDSTQGKNYTARTTQERAMILSLELQDRVFPAATPRKLSSDTKGENF